MKKLKNYRSIILQKFEFLHPLRVSASLREIENPALILEHEADCADVNRVADFHARFAHFV